MMWVSLPPSWGDVGCGTSIQDPRAAFSKFFHCDWLGGPNNRKLLPSPVPEVVGVRIPSYASLRASNKSCTPAAWECSRQLRVLRWLLSGWDVGVGLCPGVEKILVGGAGLSLLPASGRHGDSSQAETTPARQFTSKATTPIFIGDFHSVRESRCGAKSTLRTPINLVPGFGRATRTSASVRTQSSAVLRARTRPCLLQRARSWRPNTSCRSGNPASR